MKYFYKSQFGFQLSLTVKSFQMLCLDHSILLLTIFSHILYYNFERELIYRMLLSTYSI